MKKLTRNIFGIALLWLIGFACRPEMAITADTDKYADFSGYKTFAFTKTVSTGETNPQNVRLIEEAVRHELVQRGFVETTAAADVLVNIQTVVKHKQTTTTISSFSSATDMQTLVYWSQYGKDAGVTMVEESKLKDGSLIVKLTDAATKIVVWKGVINAELGKKSPADPSKLINSAVTKLMSNLPAANAANVTKS